MKQGSEIPSGGAYNPRTQANLFLEYGVKLSDYPKGASNPGALTLLLAPAYPPVTASKG